MVLWITSKSLIWSKRSNVRMEASLTHHREIPRRLEGLYETKSLLGRAEGRSIPMAPAPSSDSWRTRTRSTTAASSSISPHTRPILPSRLQQLTMINNRSRRTSTCHGARLLSKMLPLLILAMIRAALTVAEICGNGAIAPFHPAPSLHLR